MTKNERKVAELKESLKSRSVDELRARWQTLNYAQILNPDEWRELICMTGELTDRGAFQKDFSGAGIFSNGFLSLPGEGLRVEDPVAGVRASLKLKSNEDLVARRSEIDKALKMSSDEYRELVCITTELVDRATAEAETVDRDLP